MAQRKLSPLQKKYANFFFNMLDEFGVETPASLSEPKKIEFFNRIKKDWKKAKLAKESQDSKLKTLIKEISNKNK